MPAAEEAQLAFEFAGLHQVREDELRQACVAEVCQPFAGDQLFLVPPANCPDALTSDHGSMRLAKAATLKDAIAEVTAWGKNHDAPLPQCQASDKATP